MVLLIFLFFSFLFVPPRWFEKITLLFLTLPRVDHVEQSPLAGLHALFNQSQSLALWVITGCGTARKHEQTACACSSWRRTMDILFPPRADHVQDAHLWARLLCELFPQGSAKLFHILTESWRIALTADCLIFFGWEANRPGTWKRTKNTNSPIDVEEGRDNN